MFTGIGIHCHREGKLASYDERRTVEIAEIKEGWLTELWKWNGCLQ